MLTQYKFKVIGYFKYNSKLNKSWNIIEQDYNFMTSTEDNLLLCTNVSPYKRNEDNKIVLNPKFKLFWIKRVKGTKETFEYDLERTGIEVKSYLYEELGQSFINKIYGRAANLPTEEQYYLTSKI